MIEYLFLILVVPLGIILARITKDEKPIYSKAQYFPTFLVFLGIGAVVFYFFDKLIYLTLLFVFFTVVVWSKV